MISALSLPDQILSWLVNLRHCNSRAYVEQQKMDAVILKAFCSLSVKDWYTLSVLMARHLNTEKFIYRVRAESLTKAPRWVPLLWTFFQWFCGSARECDGLVIIHAAVIADWKKHCSRTSLFFSQHLFGEQTQHSLVRENRLNNMFHSWCTWKNTIYTKGKKERDLHQ